MDAEGVEPEWIRSRVRTGAEGTDDDGFVTRHGPFPSGGRFTAPVLRDDAVVGPAQMNFLGSP